VNGLPGVEVRGYAGPVAGKITWIAYGGHIYRLSNLAQGGDADRALARGEIFVRSFRPITPEDRAGIRVRRLRLARARKGEGLAEFSQRTRNDWDAQRTAIANGLFASARLVEGELLKIAVVEDYAASPDEPARRP
jgi:predicted Zn-dependent protease